MREIKNPTFWWGSLFRVSVTKVSAETSEQSQGAGKLAMDFADGKNCESRACATWPPLDVVSPNLAPQVLALACALMGNSVYSPKPRPLWQLRSPFPSQGSSPWLSVGECVGCGYRYQNRPQRDRRQSPIRVLRPRHKV